MCGIAGYVGTRAPDEERIRACLETMRRRGPDGAGRFAWAFPDGRRAVLLHTRLSIIDLSEAANQPMADGGHILVFNGELYNYRELRAELEARGERFATDSDTEVLLRILRLRGVAGLDACEGMWAFALLHPKAGVLLCRDRFGEKPLYLHSCDHGLYFASEVKGVAALKGSWPEKNLRHLRRYLVNGYKSLYKTGEGFFQDVRELAPGSWLRIAPDGGREEGRYWKPRLEQDPGMGVAEAVAGVRERILRSMELRLRADVPLAFCMSGGVDSNALIATAKRVFGYDVHGFTVIVDDARYAEAGLVALAVKELGLRHTPVPLSRQGFLERLRRLVADHDAPVGTISYYAHALLMEKIHDNGYRIALSGTGADELLTGYYDHYLMYLAALHGGPGHREAVEAWRRHVLPGVRNPLLQDSEAFVRDPGMRAHVFQDAALFSSRLTEPFLEPFEEVRYSDDLLRNRMLNELFHEVVPMILHEDDLNAMRRSIENRSPFLDRVLFEFCAGIPTGLLMADGYNKRLLREAMRGTVPAAILDNRRKVGFNLPIFSVLDREDPRIRAEVLADGPIWEIVRRETVRELLERPGPLPNTESKFLFSTLSARYFLEEVGA